MADIPEHGVFRAVRKWHVLIPISTHYNLWLVALSFLMAMATSYTAVDLAERVTVNQGRNRGAWLLGGAIAMGCGIWCMHYIGMLAFHLSIPVSYHVPTVALSLLASILASLSALYVVSLKNMTNSHAALGGAIMGSGIATMHYVGMAAMRLAAMHRYNRALWLISIVLAIGISFVGLRLIFGTKQNNRGQAHRVLVALILGLAIPVMHYSGMAAVSFQAMDVLPDLKHSVDISTLAIVAIFGITGIILAFALITSLVERRIYVQHSLFEREREILRALIDNIPDCMYVKDTEGRFIVANTRMAKVFGFDDPHLLVGKCDYDFFAADLATTFRADDVEVMRSGQGMFDHEKAGIDTEGNAIVTMTTKVPLRDGQGNILGIAGVGRDISERKKTEAALREAERKYRNMFDEALVGIFDLTADGRLLNVNPAMASFLGYDNPEEMLSSMKDPLWSAVVSPERRKEFTEQMERTGHVKSFEIEVFRKGGDRIWISSSVRAKRVDGVLIQFIGMFEDITERRLLREQLLQAQKLESVGQLAAGIAHEINTPVQYIGDNIRFLKESFQDLIHLQTEYRRLLEAARCQELTSQLLDEITKAAKQIDVDYLLQEIPPAIEQTLEGISRVSALVGAMKEFSHPGQGEKVPTDLNHAIESTVTVARNEWKYVAEMKLNLDKSLPFVSCLTGEVNQVVLNLIVNAAHAIADKAAGGGPETGLITIETRGTQGFAEIKVHDTGSGIPEGIRTRVFDPFFTTKEIGRGTGQGLAIARSVIVDKHGGTIDFESMSQKGTTFTIRLPLDAGEFAPAEVSA